MLFGSALGRGGFLGGLCVLYLVVRWGRGMVCGTATPLGSGARCYFVKTTQLVLAVFAALYCLGPVRALSMFSSSDVLSVGEVRDIHWSAEVEGVVADAEFYFRGVAIYYLGRLIQVSCSDRAPS